MKTIGIFYGSATGMTEAVARKLGKLLDVADADIYNVAETAPDVLGKYDVILAGSSTWGDGALEEDWYGFLDGARALDLAGRKAATFGCGDETMSDTFCNAVGELAARFSEMGAKRIGKFNADGYHFKHSAAYDNGPMAGLVLDEVNHPELTDARLKAWTEQLKSEI